MAAAGFSGEDMTAAKGVLIAGCVYEIVSLLTPLPTITRLTHAAKDYSPVTRVAVWAAMGAAVWHFYVED